MPWLETTPEGTALRLRVIPRADRNTIQGVQGDRLKVRLQAPPVEGKANRALLKFLAGELDVPASRLLLTAGQTGRAKTVLVRGLSETEVRRRLAPP